MSNLHMDGMLQWVLVPKIVPIDISHNKQRKTLNPISGRSKGG